MRKILISGIIGVIAAVAIIIGVRSAAGIAGTPEPVKPFAADFKERMPEAAKFEQTAPGVFSVLDAKGIVIGKLYCERIADDERQMGYAGTIEIAVLCTPDEKVAGVMIGKNQETRSFLNRVRTSGFLTRWNGLEMNEIPGREVDAVTGATRSSAAILAGVRKLAEHHLAGNHDDQKALGPVGLEAVERELGELEKTAGMHRNVLAGSMRLLKQLETRKDDELRLRLIAAIEGEEAAAAFAAKNDLMVFSHPRRGESRKNGVETFAGKYRASGDEADLKALKAAILEDYKGLLLRVPPHNREHEKALKAVETRMTALKRKLAAAAAGKNGNDQ